MVLPSFNILVILFCIIIFLKKRKQYSPDSTMMSQAAQNGHVVDPRLPPLPVDSVFGPERVTGMLMSLRRDVLNTGLTYS